MSWDTQILQAINSLAGQNAVLDSFMVSATRGLLPVVVGTAIGIWLFHDRSLKKNLYAGLTALLISRLVIVEIIKRLVARPRPFEILRVHELVEKSTGGSFPSGHAAMFFALAFGFWGTKYFWPLFVLAVIGSIARIFVGIHYPSDILAGAVIGAVTAWIFRKTLFKNQILS